MALESIIDTDAYPIGDPDFRARCRADLDRDGVLVMPGFLAPDAVETVRREGIAIAMERV